MDQNEKPLLLTNICDLKKCKLGRRVTGLAIGPKVDSIKVEGSKWTGLATVSYISDTCSLLFTDRSTICAFLNIPEEIGKKIESLASNRQLFFRPFLGGPRADSPIEQQLFYWSVAAVASSRRSIMVSGSRCRNCRPGKGTQPMLSVTSIQEINPKLLSTFTTTNGD